MSEPYTTITRATYVRVSLTLSPFGDTRGATAEELKEEAADIGETTGLSNGTGKGSLAYQSLTGPNGKEELGEETFGPPDLELQGTGNKSGSEFRDSDCIVMTDQAKPGVWGPDGLLAVPNVKTVLLLVCVVQVR